jgi:hypothetical protein
MRGARLRDRHADQRPIPIWPCRGGCLSSGDARPPQLDTPARAGLALGLLNMGSRLGATSGVDRYTPLRGLAWVANEFCMAGDHGCDLGRDLVLVVS